MKIDIDNNIYADLDDTDKVIIKKLISFDGHITNTKLAYLLKLDRAEVGRRRKKKLVQKYLNNFFTETMIDAKEQLKKMRGEALSVFRKQLKSKNEMIAHKTAVEVLKHVNPDTLEIEDKTDIQKQLKEFTEQIKDKYE